VKWVYIQNKRKDIPRPPNAFTQPEMWPDVQESRQLKDLMRTKMPHMDEDLTLFNLATIMQIHPNHLSQIINMNDQRNFFDFINYYRVEAVKELIVSKRHANKTLLSIALGCGFSSKAAFNRAFKKFTGQTPSEFKRRVSGSTAHSERES
jgi:AraC-like DNA-binding protein